MPHAEEKMSQTQTLTNGDSKSQFISHLKSYPVVSDGIDTFKANPYGAKSIEIADAAYERVAGPLEPHLRAPYSYAEPYVQKADSMAKQALTTVDNHFPIVKEDTNTIFNTVKSYAFWPFHVAGSTKDYVLSTWHSEYERTIKHNNRGPGLISFTYSIISTELKIASDALTTTADYMNTNKGDLKQKKDDLVSSAKQKKDGYAQKAQKTVDEAKQQ